MKFGAKNSYKILLIYKIICNLNKKIMTTNDISKRLAELCKNGEFETAQQELFAEDVVSIEPFPSPAFEKETHGLKKIIAKGHKFEEMVETTHSINISEPLVAANSIAFSLEMDITMKGRPRETMKELCVYKVKDGKIISEEFFM